VSEQAIARPSANDIQPTEHETLDRIATGTVTAVPFIGLGLVVWQTWESALRPSDFIVFGIMYLISGLGVTVGFHRLLTHRSFKTKPWLRGVFAAMGSIAIEGPVISWVADHRKHHAFSDQEGDPHSPHAEFGGGFRGALRGLAHAHVGWLFIHTQRGSRKRYAPDLLKDPGLRFMDRAEGLMLFLSVALPFGLGYAITGTLKGALLGLLWGGLVRIFLCHHVTFSINSICHFFGRRRFETKEHSGNVFWLAIASFGESWHHNHHAFPTSAFHGLRRREIDIGGLVILAMERLGLAWKVVRISPERQAAKTVAS
jgi:stearoyl-CoA desaturase (delta-9 desaturase)